MKIAGDGFLSKAGQQKASQICIRNEQLFETLERIISDFRTFVASQEVHEQNSDTDRQQIIALILAARILEISEAALLVMKNGMSNEANTLFRVFLDSYFLIANICCDPSFVVNYFKSDEVARIKLFNAAKKHDSDLFKTINEYANEALQDELHNKIAEEKIQAFNSYAYADNIGCSEIYDSMYRVTSASLHTTPRALEKYVELDSEGNVALIKDYPLEGNISQRATDLAYFLIKTLCGLQDIFGYLDKHDTQALMHILEDVIKNES